MAQLHNMLLYALLPWQYGQNAGLLLVLSAFGTSLLCMALLHLILDLLLTLFPLCHCCILVMLVRLTSSGRGLLPHSVSFCLGHAALPLSCHLLSLDYIVLPGILYRCGYAKTMVSMVCIAWLLSVARNITDLVQYLLSGCDCARC